VQILFVFAIPHCSNFVFYIKDLQSNYILNA
jgi:hypothetical protein